MKAIKLASSESITSNLSSQNVITDKRLLVFSSMQNNSAPDWMMNCKKRKISRVLTLPTCYNSKLFKRIIQQNSKYVKSIKPIIYNNKAAITRLKKIKNLKDLKVHSHVNIMSNYSRFLMSMSRFRGFFNLSSLMVISPLTKLSFLKHLTLEFPETGFGYEFLIDVFKELSGMKELSSLNLKLNLSAVPKRRVHLQNIMIKFTKLEKLSLNLDLSENENCGFLFSSLAPLYKLRALNLNIRSKYNMDCTDIGRFISRLKLKSLKIQFNEMSCSQYETLMTTIKGKSLLESLYIGQNKPALNKFNTEKLLECIENLQDLRKLNLGLALDMSDQQGLFTLLNYLLLHDSLEDVQMSLSMSDQQTEVTSEVLESVAGLARKLDRFDIKMDNIPQDVMSIISQILSYNARELICCE